MQLRRARSGPMIGLTPLIDVVFILLLFFMLATNFQQWRSMDLIGVANATAAAEKPKPSLMLRITPSKLSIGGQTTTQETLVNDVREQLSARPKATVVIWTSDSVPLQRLIQVMDSLRDGGISDARFNLQP